MLIIETSGKRQADWYRYDSRLPTVFSLASWGARGLCVCEGYYAVTGKQVLRGN